MLEIADVDTNGSVMTPQNSNFRGHSKSSLESAAGGAHEQVSDQRIVQKTMDSEQHDKTSECREHSQKSRSSEKGTDEEMSRNIVHQTLDRQVHQGNSENREHFQNSRKKQAGVDIGNINVTVSNRDKQSLPGVSNFLEHSQNLLLNDEPKVNTAEVNVSLSARDGQRLAASSKLRELSSNSQVETGCSQGTHHKQSAKNVCISEPSEFSLDSLGGVGSNVSVPRFSWFKSMSQIVGLTATWQQDKVEGIPREQILQVMLKQTPTQCTQSSTSFCETMISI